MTFDSVGSVTGGLMGCAASGFRAAFADFDGSCVLAVIAFAGNMTGFGMSTFGGTSSICPIALDIWGADWVGVVAICRLRAGSAAFADMIKDAGAAIS
jgi:hypothetical protein